MLLWLMHDLIHELMTNKNGNHNISIALKGQLQLQSVGITSFNGYTTLQSVSAIFQNI